MTLIQPLIAPQLARDVLPKHLIQWVPIMKGGDRENDSIAVNERPGTADQEEFDYATAVDDAKPWKLSPRFKFFAVLRNSAPGLMHSVI